MNVVGHGGSCVQCWHMKWWLRPVYKKAVNNAFQPPSLWALCLILIGLSSKTKTGLTLKHEVLEFPPCPGSHQDPPFTSLQSAITLWRVLFPDLTVSFTAFQDYNKRGAYLGEKHESWAGIGETAVQGLWIWVVFFSNSHTMKTTHLQKLLR